MAAFFPAGFFFLIIIGVIVAMIFAHKQSNARRVALLAWAQQSGFDYTPSKDRVLRSRIAHFDCFDRGDDRYAENVMTSQRGDRHVACFDWHYETTTTDSDGDRRTQHHWSSNVLFTVDFLASDLRIRKESVFDKIGQAFGWNDIDFESAEFSRKFHVKAKDKRWAYDVISPRTMEILLATPQFEIRMHGRHLLVRRDGRVAARVYGQALVLGEAFLGAIPADVVAERRRRLQGDASRA